jgi:hypothetical protein
VRPRRLDVRIESLVLDGFDPHDPVPLAQALRVELDRLSPCQTAISALTESERINRFFNERSPVELLSTEVGSTIARSRHERISGY